MKVIKIHLTALTLIFLDCLEWIFQDLGERMYKDGSFFGVDGTPENAKVKIASIHLEGKALLWHQSHMRAFAVG